MRGEANPHQSILAPREKWSEKRRETGAAPVSGGAAKRLREPVLSSGGFAVTVSIVERFAQALDDEDYATAALCLDAGAEYDSGEKTILGVDDIIDSFRDAAERGRKTFDSVTFRHEISSQAQTDIRFLDRLSRNGDTFELDHTMHLTISDRGTITHLRLTYPPGERERLRAFLEKSAGDSSRASGEAAP